MKSDYRNIFITRSYLQSRTVCVGLCQKIRTNIHKTKKAVLKEFEGAFSVPPHLLELAINEAEALAWENPFPHLVFPTLAQEKAKELAVWQTRQQSLLHSGSVLEHAH